MRISWKWKSILKDMIVYFVVGLVVMVGSIIFAQFNWSWENLKMHYAHAGVWHDLVIILIPPAVFAGVVGLIEAIGWSWFLRNSTKGE